MNGAVNFDMSEEDNSVFRHKIADRLKKIDGFSGLVEEYGVSLGGQGGSIDILVKIKSNGKIIYLVVECKDCRGKTLEFPNVPIQDLEKYNWGLYYQLRGREKATRYSIESIETRPTYYSTDLSVTIPASKKEKHKDQAFDEFYKWTTQLCSNFMRFVVEEKNTRSQKEGTLEDFYVIPIFLSSASMAIDESIIVNPHPYLFNHLAVDLRIYVEPLVRGELKKTSFILIHEKNMEKSVNSLVQQIASSDSGSS